MSELLPGIYVGDANTARDAAFFARNNITRVVNCTPHIPFYFPNVKYMRIPVYDADTPYNNKVMKTALPLALAFALNPRPSVEQGVLIHCQAGVSRSCTVAVAVLRVCCASSLQQAVALCRARRPIAFFGGLVFNFRQTLGSMFAPETVK